MSCSCVDAMWSFSEKECGDEGAEGAVGGGEEDGDEDVGGWRVGLGWGAVVSRQ